MRIHEFSELFPDEKTCKLHFKKEREELGIKCKKYGKN
jgi:hypothetical protein